MQTQAASPSSQVTSPPSLIDRTDSSYVSIVSGHVSTVSRQSYRLKLRLHCLWSHLHRPSSTVQTQATSPSSLVTSPPSLVDRTSVRHHAAAARTSTAVVMASARLRCLGAEWLVAPVAVIALRPCSVRPGLSTIRERLTQVTRRTSHVPVRSTNDGDHR